MVCFVSDPDHCLDPEIEQDLKRITVWIQEMNRI